MDNNKKLAKELLRADGIDPENITDSERTMLRDLLDQQLKSKSSKPFLRHNIWRIIMKSNITKFAAAAVIIVAVLLSLNIENAYALEDTINAYRNLRSVHIKDFRDKEPEPKEMWIKFNEQEQVDGFRVSIPAWDIPSEGPKVVVWENNKAQVWIKNKNVILTIDNRDFASGMCELVKQCDPRFMIEQLYQLEAEGKVTLDIDASRSDTESIIITATYLDQSDYPGGKMVFSVDPKTFLVTNATADHMKNFGGYQNSGRLEYSDYNVEIDENVFTLSDAPDNVIQIDRTSPEVGLTQGDLTDEQAAMKLAEQFLQALADNDNARIGNLCGGIPENMTQNLKYVVPCTKVLSVEKAISKPNRRSKRAMSVPCVFQTEKENEVFALRKNITVEPLEGNPNVWIVNFEKDNEPAQIVTDPTDMAASEFLESVNAKLALLDINKSTAADVIKVLGKPLSYQLGREYFDENNLPETYYMNYPGYFMLFIHKKQIRSWGSEETPGYMFSDSVRIGATLNEVLAELGPPAKIIEGIKVKGIKFQENILYKNMNMKKGYHCYVTMANRKKIRMFFRDNKIFSLHEQRTEPIEE